MNGLSIKPGRARLGILVLVTLATMLNYLDRSVMGVAKPAMVEELSISPATMGFIFSAFSWTYALARSEERRVGKECW